MQILIVGAGKVGFETADRLSNEGHDVVVIDKRSEVLEEVSAHLDVMTLVGNGASPDLLEEAGVERTDIMLAVTEVDEVNMIACMTAKQYGVKTCVARIRNPEYISKNPHALSLAKLGVDVMIDPERLAAHEITALLKTPMATEIEHFAEGQISVVGLRVDHEAAIVGRQLAEARIPNFLVVALVRDDQVIIPTGTDVVQATDRIFIVGKAGHIREVRAFVGNPKYQIRKVTIMGASKIGRNLAERLTQTKRQGIAVTLLEKDAARARAIARALPHVLVIHGDGTKIDVLREEGIAETDAFVAVSGEDHTDLLGTMLAKQLGVSEVIAAISRADYVPLAKQAGADAVVVPRLLAVSTMLRLVRRSEIVSMMILEEGKAEALEMIAAVGAPIVGRPLREISFPSGAIVGAVQHGQRIEVARGDTVIQARDRVIVFTLPEVVQRVEDLFRAPSKVRG